ncbi:MAG: C1 family peptidase [Bacteroidota bacterium]
MRNYYLLVAITLALVVAFSGCDPKDDEPDPVVPHETEYGLGLTDDNDMSTVPMTTNFGFGADNLPAAYSIVDKFPPIGDQGQYGTCTAWALGYNCKTTINGIENGYNSNDLASPNKQFSPKDLFTAIADNLKGENCGGSNFEDALNIMQNRGIATMQTVPYTNLGNCSQSGLDPSWTQEASGFKISYWRKVEGSVSAIKKNISQNVPVVFGAKLADNFMTHKSDEVISSATSYDNVGQHAYHALIICGYDDNKGPNGAFRVVNSWGQSWGSTGYCWVDYNFFFNEFLMGEGEDKVLFIAANQSGDIDPPDPDPNPVTSGVDLVPWVFADWSTNNIYWPTERSLTFNIYNIGNADALASADWSYYHIYYNAYDANDYGVIFYDQFNTSVAENTYYCPQEWNCIFNMPIPAGNNFAYYAWLESSVVRTYYMPEITGYYYLLTIADAEDKFQEQNEMNNLFYTSIDPMYFESGTGFKSSSFGAAVSDFKNDVPMTDANIKNSKFNSVVTPKFKNAYTQKEILAFFKEEKKNGRLDKKVNEYIQRNAGYKLPGHK